MNTSVKKSAIPSITTWLKVDWIELTSVQKNYKNEYIMLKDKCMLEPYEVKVSRTVLRRERGSNSFDLADKIWR
ncbi:hypothetical protein AN640_02445 [Candidatus Epulonipiscium fishelsonii]|uniref:Uncharacterized protein n=1 Tax=Candidatus Epulonipiscium fishelsonii TaxID=77094 RepID=A0ACC8X9A8_9FIRM|nr:hypothetical protein AN640_02445 [Epulopiscium sp. SCG-D08WGA-EpuloA1]OON91107.1 MAG: hypothetical protein ATN32_02560 [Epulopiscium sp. AS2M-Bin002]